ncbi:hypothetical protein T484DRAFT_1887393 [Baffinella frigidus]|nr:hypothetical protein T484DRAFT_1887393 [Cryptophyta sp. CCMP2293]
MQRYDASLSGTLDSFEFEHMVRIMLAKPCDASCPACVDPKFRNMTGEDVVEMPEDSPPGSPIDAPSKGASLMAQMQAEMEAEERAKDAEMARLREEVEENARLEAAQEAARILAKERREEDEAWTAGIASDLRDEALQRSESREGELCNSPTEGHAPRMAGMVRLLRRRVSDGGNFAGAAAAAALLHAASKGAENGSIVHAASTLMPPDDPGDTSSFHRVLSGCAEGEEEGGEEGSAEAAITGISDTSSASAAFASATTERAALEDAGTSDNSSPEERAGNPADSEEGGAKAGAPFSVRAACFSLSLEPDPAAPHAPSSLSGIPW